MNYKRFSLLIIPFPLFLLCISGYSQKKYYVSTLAGDTSNMYKGIDSNAGFHDGAASSALFNAPTGIAVDISGNVYVADTYNNVIRKINVTNNSVTTIAGDTSDIKKGLDSNAGYLDGTRYKAQFNNPFGVCVDDSGNVYVADTYNNVIRKISVSTGIVSTYAGRDSSGITFEGYINGPDSLAEFFAPTSLAVDSIGNVYVADYGNSAIREIWASTHQVTTLAGHGPDSSGYMNGPIDTAEFIGLYGITLGNIGRNATHGVFTTQAENGANAIRRIYHDTVTTYSGFDTVGFDLLMYNIPSGYANGNDSIYHRGDTVLQFIDTIPNIGGALLYNDPTGIAFDTSGNLLVADEYNNVIRLVKPPSTPVARYGKQGVVSTFAGNQYNDSVTFMNGWDSLAVFYNPVGVVADKKGNVYVADLGNNLIRKIALQSVTGISQIKKPEYTLNVYPNPCTDRLTIVSSFNGKVDMLDVTGRVILTDDNFKSPYTLSTSAIFPGVYFLRITSTTMTEIRKIEVVK